MSESVAIVEKKPHKPGGCAGIFFQLFEWNRRFAQKKLKKLLPPAQSKQCERKFGRDEKLPKLRLITNEKDGGGNNNSKQKPQMRSPSLVAKLMGLESMPAVQKSKPSYENSVLQTDNEGDKSTKTQNVFGFNLEDGNGNEKHELRPQKAQKTGSYESKALTKFKSDVFHFENLLSRSKKHHRPKLASPLKNPKTSSRKTSSRLIDVASRILEPSLKNTNRAKSAITYTSNTRDTIGNNFAMEQEKVSLDIPESSEFHFPTNFLPISSCKHCGNQLERSDLPVNFEEKVTPFSSSNSIYSNINEEIKRSSIVPSKPSFEEAKCNKKQFSREGKHQRGSQSSIGLKHQTFRQSQDPVVRDRVPRQRHRDSSASTDFEYNGKRMPMRFEENNRRGGGSLSPVRKRRTMSTNHSSENSKYLSSNIVNQRNVKSNIVGKKEKEREIRLDSHSFDSTNSGSTMRRDTKGINVTSSAKKKMVSDEKLNAEKLIALNGDELGAILQQKMKELNSQEDDELSSGNEPKRSTAVILQELISALTAEKEMLRDDVAVEYGEKVPCLGPQLPNKRLVFENNTARTLLSYLPEDEHPSPGSVLEASFSNDSCLSSNFGDGSEIYYDGALKPELDLIRHVSEVLLSLSFTNTSLNQSKLAYAKDVILNMELISKNKTQTLSLLRFLMYEFENLATTMLSEFSRLLGFEDETHKNQIREFAFDCLIEYVDTKYGRYTSCGLVPWTKMPLCSIANDLVDEIRWWMGFDGYALDDIIDFEMSRSYGKWDDFGIEEYETGAEIGKHLLQILVDEIVVELFKG